MKLEQPGRQTSLKAGNIIAGRKEALMHTSIRSRPSSAKSGRNREVWECERVWSLLGTGLNYILLVGLESGRRWNLRIYC